jgi:hypothetical protein
MCSADEKWGSADEKWGSADEKWGSADERWGPADENWGSADEKWDLRTRPNPTNFTFLAIAEPIAPEGCVPCGTQDVGLGRSRSLGA